MRTLVAAAEPPEPPAVLVPVTITTAAGCIYGPGWSPATTTPTVSLPLPGRDRMS